ncbi:hypothetical protein E4P42_00865 [Mycobacterium sp. PS03-16]|uniref:DUF5994 family protein n=1 Tax=Mycobacterium sp. PS03-16 TaxID=2559611 RepID=UPI001073F873|nr:DUF5994 family protein [Mycobacterium sp. PS03-16]TFV61482.1 hypothetical protein E4P42_00865 [Mycobacterium sp. PS03-16]
MSATDLRGGPGDLIRLTVAAMLGGDLDGAWWPYSTSMARELPQLIEVLNGRVGSVLDITVNWSSLEGARHLDPRSAHRGPAFPGQRARHKRVLTATGKRATAHLLVVPPDTNRALAVMVLRQAAALPILAQHQDSEACRAAAEIVHTARTECAHRSAVRDGLAPAADPVLLD